MITDRTVYAVLCLIVALVAVGVLLIDDIKGRKG